MATLYCSEKVVAKGVFNLCISPSSVCCISRALEFMQVFLAEVARGEKDLAVAAGRLSTIFRFDKEYTFGILNQLTCFQTFTLSYFVPLLKNLYLHVSNLLFVIQS